MASKKTDDDRSLKRLGGGRWQTRDERFAIEPQSGTWVLVDTEQTDDLGLPLVRGPFRSLTDAKAAVEAARATAAPESPLADRVKDATSRQPRATAAKEDARSARKPAGKVKPGPVAEPEAPKVPEPPPEPRWIAALAPRDRGRARRLIQQLDDAGVRDAEGIVRQDLTGGVPTVARLVLADELVALLPASDEDDRAVERIMGRLAEAVDSGRDEALGVRWRLVDGDDRPLGLTSADIHAALKRRSATTGKETER
jgi:hypothetical protein